MLFKTVLSSTLEKDKIISLYSALGSLQMHPRLILILLSISETMMASLSLIFCEASGGLS